MAREEEVKQRGIPWRDTSSFVSTYYSILTAMAGAILVLAIGDPAIKDCWYLPVGLLSLSLTALIWGLEKCGEAIDEDDVDKYLAWLLAYDFGTLAMFFGIASYILVHYRPTWTIFIGILILTTIASWKWLKDIRFLLFVVDAEYKEYRDELLGNCQPEKDPDWLMHLLAFFRHLRSGRGKE
jgi:hypothetical protein